MVNEAKVKTYLHSWGTMPVMDGNRAIGVIFESKSGRQAIMAKMVIATTGDGDYMVTLPDLNTNGPFEDTIAIFPDLDRGDASLKYPLTFIPYRSLLPKGVDNMLVACRAFSSDQPANNFFNLIPPCIAMGEAAGAAAALSLSQGVKANGSD